MKTLLELDTVEFHTAVYAPNENGRAVVTIQYITTYPPQGYDPSDWVPHLRPFRMPDGSVVVYDRAGKNMRFVERTNVRTWTPKKQVTLDVLSASLDAGKTLGEVLNPAPSKPTQPTKPTQAA